MFFCWFLPFLYTTSYTISYTTSYVKYTISYVKNTISYIKYTISYTTSYKMCDIVCFCCWFLPFLYTTSYTISYKKVRCRIRYATSRRYYTISYVHIVCLVAIIRYRTSKSQKTYDVIVRCRMRFFYKYLGWRLQRVALAMPLERPQVLPHDPRPSPMVCTASW
jgi:hypothetical protein